MEEKRKARSLLTMVLALVLALALLPAWPAAADWSPGSVDPGFDTSWGPNSTVHAIALQPDGKVLIAGNFTEAGGYGLGRIARLNADGSGDAAFNPGSGADGTVRAIALQSNAKILIGGDFTAVDGVARSRIARLNADGSLDTSFDPGSGADAEVHAVAVQPDGKVLIGGAFTTLDGTARNSLARLNADGSLDATFDPGSGANDTVYAVALQPDGQVIIGGSFVTVDGVARSSIARLEAGGSLDATFNPGSGADGTVYTLGLQANGQIVIGGNFTTLDGTARARIARLEADGSLDTGFDPGSGASSTVYALGVQVDAGSGLSQVVIGGMFDTVGGTARNSLARLNADGSLDTGFVPGIEPATFDMVRSIALQPDGKILAGGGFTAVDGVECDHLARLHPDGSVDAPLKIALGADGTIWDLALQADGKAIIGGGFETVDGMTRNSLARLNTGGSLDTTFSPNLSGGASDSVEAVAVQSDGKVLIGGWFWTVDGVDRHRIARLNGDGSLDPTFDPGTGANGAVRTLALQSDGKVVIGGSFTTVDGTARSHIARLNADGSLDTTFDPGTGADGEVWAVAVQSDGQVLLGGSFTSYDGTGRNYVARLNADGSLDTTFDPGTGADAKVWTLAVQTDGQVLIGGGFATYDGVARARIARLNADGSLDTTFDPGTGGNGSVLDMALQADGKLLVAGSFGTMGGVPRDGIARLETDGSLDTTFDPGAGAEDGQIDALAVQPDGKTVIGGHFETVDGVAKNHVARLNADGSLDATFGGEPGANNEIYAAAFEATGKVPIGGGFTAVDGVPRGRIARLNARLALDTTFDPGAGSSNRVRVVVPVAGDRVLVGGDFATMDGTPRGRIARLDADGSVDATFDTSVGANGTVYAIAVQSDGKIVIGGDFTTFDGQPRLRIARLDTDGSLDATFDPGSGADARVYALAIQPDGHVILGGDFTTVGGQPHGRVARLDAGGALDATFDPGIGANGAVYTLALLDGGSGSPPVLIGGSFTAVAGTPCGRLARLDASGAIDTGFDPGTGADGLVRAVAVQSNGQILVGGDFTLIDGTSRAGIARLEADGTLDAAFDPGTGADDTVYAVVPQPDGRVLIAGAFLEVNGTPRNRIARLHGATPPVITSGAPPSAATVGVAYHHTFVASGYPLAPTFSVIAGRLPPGLALDPSSGVLSGVPAAGGDYYCRVRACNYVAPCATQDGSFTVEKADTTTAITAHTPDPSTTGQTVTVEYSVTSAGGTPTGNVTVSDGEVSCTGTVAAGRCTLIFTTTGVRTLVATYAGDAGYTGSTSAGVTHTVERGTYTVFLPLVAKNASSD